MVLLALGCQDQEVQAPIDSDKMINILVDVRTLEGSYSAIVGKPDTVRPLMKGYYDHVFAKHGITHEDYLNALGYYYGRPLLMEGIEDSVINRLSDRLNKLQQRDIQAYQGPGN
jgi:Domain of unknown function (DUF4296)